MPVEPVRMTVLLAGCLHSGDAPADFEARGQSAAHIAAASDAMGPVDPV